MISGLHHYALEVPDLAVAEGFLQDFGLDTTEKDGSLVAMCPGRQQEQARLVEAPVKRLHHVAFTLRPGAMDAVREALERSGTPVIEPPPGATEDGLWLRDPDGTAVQLLDEPQAAARPAAEILVNMGGTRQRFDIAQWREATRDVLPRRLGHSLLFTAQPRQMTAFYTEVLGLRVSDTIHHDLVTFLNAGPGDHHVFGFISSTHRGFHHASSTRPNPVPSTCGSAPPPVPSPSPRYGQAHLVNPGCQPVPPPGSPTPRRFAHGPAPTPGAQLPTPGAQLPTPGAPTSHWPRPTRWSHVHH